MRKGLFITFEGGEGTGKSTQMKRLAAWLKTQGHAVVVTREPGGSSLGTKIRKLLLDPANTHLSPRAEALLYQADRAQHVDEVIRPALAAGKVVVSDRFADSSTVYQGICRGLGVTWVKQLNRFSTQELVPDLVLVLDLAVETGLARVKKRTGKIDRLEAEKLDFHCEVRSGFRKLAKEKPARYALIDASQDIEAVSLAIRQAVKRKLKRK